MYALKADLALTSTIDAVLREQALLQPDRLSFAEGDDTLTFGELSVAAGRIAAALQRLGLRPGDRVVLALPAGLSFVRFFYGAQRLGAATCVVNPFAPAETVARRSALVRPALVLVDNHELAAAAQAAGLRALRLDEVTPGIAGLESSPATGEDVAVLQLTSGTSGESRAVILLHRNILAYQSITLAAAGAHPADVSVSWVPPWHDLGLIKFIIGSVYFGAPCHLVQPAVRTIPLWIQTIARVRGSVTGAPDFAWRLAARIADPALDLTCLRHATNGGEPIRLSTIRTFEAKYQLHNAIRPGYGLAEATLGATFMRQGEDLQIDSRGNVSSGKAFPGIDVKIAEDGEILIQGPTVFAGYFEAEEATRGVLRDGWLYTGDFGHLDDQGYLYVLGRKRSMLKRGGAVIAPRELEDAALTVRDVRMAAAVAVPSPGRTTEEIVVMVESNREVADEISDAIRAALGFAPERVVVVGPRTIPLTANGKVRYGILREMLTAS